MCAGGPRSYTLITNPLKHLPPDELSHSNAISQLIPADTSFILFLFFPSAIRERERAQIGVWLRQKSER